MSNKITKKQRLQLYEEIKARKEGRFFGAYEDTVQPEILHDGTESQYLDKRDLAEADKYFADKAREQKKIDREEKKFENRHSGYISSMIPEGVQPSKFWDYARDGAYDTIDRVLYQATKGMFHEPDYGPNSDDFVLTSGAAKELFGIDTQGKDIDYDAAVKLYSESERYKEAMENIGEPLAKWKEDPVEAGLALTGMMVGQTLTPGTLVTFAAVTGLLGLAGGLIAASGAAVVSGGIKGYRWLTKAQAYHKLGAKVQHLKAAERASFAKKWPKLVASAERVNKLRAKGGLDPYKHWLLNTTAVTAEGVGERGLVSYLDSKRGFERDPYTEMKYAAIGSIFLGGMASAILARANWSKTGKMAKEFAKEQKIAFRSLATFDGDEIPPDLLISLMKSRVGRDLIEQFHKVQGIEGVGKATAKKALDNKLNSLAGHQVFPRGVREKKIPKTSFDMVDEVFKMKSLDEFRTYYRKNSKGDAGYKSLEAISFADASIPGVERAIGKAMVQIMKMNPTIRADLLMPQFKDIKTFKRFTEAQIKRKARQQGIPEEQVKLVPEDVVSLRQSVIQDLDNGNWAKYGGTYKGFNKRSMPRKFDGTKFVNDTMKAIYKTENLSELGLADVYSELGGIFNAKSALDPDVDIPPIQAFNKAINSFFRKIDKSKVHPGTKAAMKTKLEVYRRWGRDRLKEGSNIDEVTEGLVNEFPERFQEDMYKVLHSDQAAERQVELLEALMKGIDLDDADTVRSLRKVLRNSIHLQIMKQKMAEHEWKQMLEGSLDIKNLRIAGSDDSSIRSIRLAKKLLRGEFAGDRKIDKYFDQFVDQEGEHLIPIEIREEAYRKGVYETNNPAIPKRAAQTLNIIAHWHKQMDAGFLDFERRFVPYAKEAEGFTRRLKPQFDNDTIDANGFYQTRMNAALDIYNDADYKWVLKPGKRYNKQETILAIYEELDPANALLANQAAKKNGMLSDLFNPIDDPIMNSESLFGNSKFWFKDPTKRIEFMNKYNAPSEVSHLADSMNLRSAKIRAAVLQSQYGADPNVAVDRIMRWALKRGFLGDELNADDIRRIVVDELSGLKAATHPRAGWEKKLYTLVQSAKAIGSGLLTGNSPIRNMFWDNTYLPAIQAAMAGHGSVAGNALGNFFDIGYAMVARDRANEAKALFGNIGAANLVRHNLMAEGIADLTQVGRIEAKGLGYKSARAFSDAFSYLSLAESTMEAATLSQFTFVATQFDRFLNNVGKGVVVRDGLWDDVLYEVMKSHNLKKADLAVVRDLPSITFQGFRNGGKMRDSRWEIFQAIDDKDINLQAARRSGESIDQTRLRIMMDFNNALEGFGREFAAIPTYNSRVFRGRGGELDSYGILATQFMDIANAQAMNIHAANNRVGMIRGVPGLSPTNAGMATIFQDVAKTPIMLMRYLPHFFAGGYMIDAFKDLSDGRPPGAITPGAILSAGSQTLPHVLAVTAYNTMSYGDGGVTAPGVQPLKEAFDLLEALSPNWKDYGNPGTIKKDIDRYKVGEEALDLSPNTWWLQYGKNYLADEVFMSEAKARRRERDGSLLDQLEELTR